jgi:serine-type D-Ala-D-Ala carboxypeptidase (penicillin-binding protein 5/6)
LSSIYADGKYPGCNGDDYMRMTLFSRHCLILTALIYILLNLGTFPVKAETETVPKIDAPSAVLMELSKMQPLFEKDSTQRLHIAIANKIMTTLLALEKTKPDAKVTISQTAANTKGSMLELEVGGKYIVEDLLYAVMLTPSNDASIAIAEHISGESEAFVALMNTRAKELGLKDTQFVNPTGLIEDGQFTTAQDLAKLTVSALSNPLFSRYFSSKGAPWNDGNNTQLLMNRNKLFWSYDGVDGGKVGYNNKVRQAAITTATRDNLRLMAIVLDSPEESVFTDSSALFDYGFNNFKTGLLVQKGQRMKSLQIGEAELNLVCASDVYYTYPIGKNYIKDIQFNVQKDLKLPIDQGKTLGTITYTLNDETKISVDLQADRHITLPERPWDRFQKRLLENIDLFVLVGLLLVIEVVLMFYYLGKLLKRLFNRTPKQNSLKFPVKKS